MKKEKKINESLIGKIIYGFLMFAPLLAIMFTSLYATFNPNAKESYSGTQTQINVTYQYETNEVNSVDDLIVGNIYILNMENFDTSILPNGLSRFLDFSYFSFNRFGADTITINILESNENLSYGYLLSGNILYYAFYYTTNPNSNYYYRPLSELYNYKMYFVYEGGFNNRYNIIDYVSISDYLGEPIIEETEAPGTLDNAFYYALDKTEDSTLFNWAKNTGIYTVLHNACSGLGITTTFIPFILTYWLLISLVYLIYDLVLVFVHIAHKKMHELEDF